MFPEFLRRADIRIGEACLTAGHDPPRRLRSQGSIPVVADARHCRLAVVEANSDLARLDPIEDKLRFARMPAFGDPMFDLDGGVLAFKVFHLPVDDEPLVLADLLDP